MFRWTKEDKNNLLGYYKQCRDTEDTIAHISQKYCKSGITNKTQISIIRELLEQNIINESQYNDFMKEQQPEQEKETENLHNELNIQEHSNDNEIRALKECLFRENKGKLLLWLQKLLTEACFVKLFLSKPEDFSGNQNIMEPTVYYYAREYLSVPRGRLTSFCFSIEFTDTGGAVVCGTKQHFGISAFYCSITQTRIVFACGHWKDFRTNSQLLERGIYIFCGATAGTYRSR